MYSSKLRNDLYLIADKDMIDDGLNVILIMNGLLSGPAPDQEPAKLFKMKDAMAAFNLENSYYTYGYLKYDQQNNFSRYVNQGYPVSVFIDAKDMKIVKHIEGWTSEEDSINEIKSFVSDSLSGK